GPIPTIRRVSCYYRSSKKVVAIRSDAASDRRIVEDKQHAQLHQSPLHLPTGCAPAWDRRRRFAQNFRWWREWKQLFFRFSSSEPRLFEGNQQHRATANPELLFLLMAGYSNANLQGEGAEFFSARLKEFDSRLTAPQKALYLSAIGLLRAQHASSISLLSRV